MYITGRFLTTDSTENTDKTDSPDTVFLIRVLRVIRGCTLCLAAAVLFRPPFRYSNFRPYTPPAYGGADY
jgi:hypothetical protein